MLLDQREKGAKWVGLADIQIGSWGHTETLCMQNICLFVGV